MKNKKPDEIRLAKEHEKWTHGRISGRIPVEDVYRDIGFRISLLMGRNGIRSGELAKKLGITHSALSHITNPTIWRITIPKLFEIANALGVEASELLAGIKYNPKSGARANGK